MYDEYIIGQINFYDKNGGNLYKMGGNTNSTGKRETFLIGENERLIGCEIDYGARWV